MRKRGRKAASIITILVIIVLALIVLTVLVVGFSSGWSNLSGRFEIFNPKANVDLISQGCELACKTNIMEDYCERERDLSFGDGKTAKGSCKAFEKLDEIDISCPDIQCEGEEAKCKKSGEEVDCFTWEKEQIVVLYPKAEEELGTIQGQPAVQTRKQELGIPDKFCYWQQMAELYKDKCTELNEQQIQDIFDKKKVYREENTPGWAELNSDRDFCVDVVFDYTAWEGVKKIYKNVGRAGGCWDGKKIYISPVIDWKKEILVHSLFHEGLHSVQNSVLKQTHIVEGQTYTVDTLQQISIEKARAQTGKGLDKVCEDLKLIFEEAKEIANLKDSISDLETNYNALCILVPFTIPSVDFTYDYANNFLKILEGEGIYTRAEVAINNYKNTYYDIYLDAHATQTKAYVGWRIEIDPRLSDVQIWWLDKNNCEIILSLQQAKTALDSFLKEENLPQIYKKTQAELKALLDVYKKEGKEQEVYDALITRLPGIAKSEEMYEESLEEFYT